MRKKDAWTLATPTPPQFKVGQHLYCGTAVRPGHVRATAHPTTLNSGVGGFGYTCFLAGVFFFALTGTSCLAFFVHNSLRSYLVVLQEEASAEDSVRLAVSYNPLSSFPKALPTAGMSARIQCRLLSSSKKNPTQRIPRNRKGTFGKSSAWDSSGRTTRDDSGFKPTRQPQGTLFGNPL